MVYDFFFVLQSVHLSVEHDWWVWRHNKNDTFLVVFAYNLQHLVSLLVSQNVRDVSTFLV